MKILFVTTISNTINAFLIPHIRLLVEKGHQVDIACNITQMIKPELIELGCEIHNIEFQRSPLNKQNYSAYKKLKDLIRNKRYNIIHTHTPVASACVRLACRKMKNTSVIYTAHGFHFYNGAPLVNWLIYYPIERWLAKYTEVLLTINKEDYKRAKKSFKSCRVEYVPGVGLDIKKFNKVQINKLRKRKELNVPKDAFVIVSVGELNKNKNHETIINAIAKLNNPKIYYLICGIGPLEKHLINISTKLSLENNIKLLNFREDIAEICMASDIFAFPSYREGLGLSALEAMATGLPLVTSNVHGIVDYSINGVTGYSCDPKDVDCFAKNIKKLYTDVNIRKYFSENNIKKVLQYDLNEIEIYMKDIYEKVIFQCEK
jgi:glycosyltransferase involved in cell wall biosynthesis